MAIEPFVPTEADNNDGSDEEKAEEKLAAEPTESMEECAIAQPAENSCGEEVAASLRYEDLTLDVVSPDGEKFEDLNISKHVLYGLEFIGYKHPSPVQAKAIPPGLTGRDLIVQAKAGTGKTCVFVVIALELVNTALSDALQVLVVTVTPEVCFQVYETFRKIGHFTKGLKCFYTVGGTFVEQDLKSLKESHIVIGSIGRLCHLIKCGFMSPDSVKLLVLDELDKLQEDSVIANFNWLFHHLRPNKQIVTASATYPIPLQECLFPYMRDPCVVQLSSNNDHLLGIKEYVMINMKRDVCIWETRMDALAYLLKEVAYDQCIIFTNLQTRVEQIAGDLEKRDVKAETVVGTMSLRERMKVIRQLIREKYRLIVTTDLYSRGIDLPRVNFIINVEVPTNWLSYEHRIGRAGRFGRQGAAVTLVCQHRDSDEFFAMARGCFSHFKIIPKLAPKDLVTNVDFFDRCQSCAFDNVTPGLLWQMLRNFNALLDYDAPKGGDGVKLNGPAASNKKLDKSKSNEKRIGENSTAKAKKGGRDMRPAPINGPCTSAGQSEGQRRSQGGCRPVKNFGTGWQASPAVEKREFLLEYIRSKMSGRSTAAEAEDAGSRCYDSRVFCEVLERCMKEEPPPNPEVTALMVSIPKRTLFYSAPPYVAPSGKDHAAKQSAVPANKEGVAEDFHAEGVTPEKGSTKDTTNSELPKERDEEGRSELLLESALRSDSASNAAEQNSAPLTYLQQGKEGNSVSPEEPYSNAQLSAPESTGFADVTENFLRSLSLVEKSEEGPVFLPTPNPVLSTQDKEMAVEDEATEFTGYSPTNSGQVNLEERTSLQDAKADAAADPTLSREVLSAVEAAEKMREATDGEDSTGRSSTEGTPIHWPLEDNIEGAEESVNSSEDEERTDIPRKSEHIDAVSAFERELDGTTDYVEHMLAFDKCLN